MDSNFASSTNCDDFARILGFTPGFAEYLKLSLEGKILESKTIKESGGKTSVLLTFKAPEDLSSDKHGKKGRQISRQHQSHEQSSKKFNSAANPQPISLPKKKRKSPSRRRRDRERFRKFIENKRQRALNSTQLSHSSSHSSHRSSITSSVVGSPSSYQCSPDQGETVSVAEPPTVTLSLDAQVPPSEPVLAECPVSNPEPQPCKCDICTKIATSPDLSTALYLECTSCLTAASEVEGGLRPCSRCLLQAYCSKECQSKDWKTHKTHCDKDSADRIRKLRDEYSQMREVAKVHAECPDTRPPVS